MKNAVLIALALAAVSACKKDAKKSEPTPGPAPTDKATDKPTPPGDPKPADPTPDPKPVEPAPPPAEDAGKPFTSTDGGYTITFPGEPTEQTQSMPTENGTLDIHIAALDLGNAAYLAGWQVQPKKASKDPKEVLDGAQSGMLESFPGAKVLSQKDIKLDGTYPGRDLVVRLADPDATQFSRYYLVGDHLYQMAAIAEGEGDPAKAAKFLDSFKLAKK
jgi:hypothetical protein